MNERVSGESGRFGGRLNDLPNLLRRSVEPTTQSGYWSVRKANVQRLQQRRDVRSVPCLHLFGVMGVIENLNPNNVLRVFMVAIEEFIHTFFVQDIGAEIRLINIGSDRCDFVFCP